MSNNILFILPFYTLGGAETQAFNIALTLKEKGYKVSFFAFEKKNGKLIEKLEEHHISWKLSTFNLHSVHQPGLKKLFDLFKVVKEVRSFSPDFLMPFTYYPNIVISSIWKLTGAKKCFWNQRGLEHNGFSIVEKIAKKMKPEYIGNSKACTNYIENRHQLNKDSLQVIHNGIELIEPKNDTNYWIKLTQKEEGELIYTMVANFYPEKNHFFLLKAWKIFTEKHLDKKLKLVLIGYIPSEHHFNKIKTFAFDYQITNILFLPSTNDVAGLLKVSDYGLLTSSSEGCPNSVLEYMLNQKLAIISKIPATEEIFPDNYPFFCDLGDSNTLVNCFENSLNHYLVDKSVKENHQLVVEKFNMKSLVDKYDELFKAHR